MEHELVGKLLHSRSEGVVYRVESVDEDAIPSEQELTLRPVYACKDSSWSKRSKESRTNWMAGTGHQSIRWAALVSKVTERDVERMREHDQ
jgi:hypothetical protein